MKKFLIATALLAAPVLALAEGTGSSTPSVANAVYPIADLGGCSSRDACKAYCDITANQSACLTYAQSHNLMPKAAVDKARELIKSHDSDKNASSTKPTLQTTVKRVSTSTLESILKSGAGPGGCSSLGECKTYCSDSSHQTECVAFGTKYGLLKPDTSSMSKEHMGSSTGMMGSSTMQKPPLPTARGTGTSTRPTLGTTTKPLTGRDGDDHGKMGSSTNGTPPKPPMPASGTQQSGSGCTVDQAELGLCTPPQQNTNNDDNLDNLPGAVWHAVSNFFHI